MGNKCCGTNNAITCDYDQFGSSAAGVPGPERRPGKGIRQSLKRSRNIERMKRQITDEQGLVPTHNNSRMSMNTATS